MAEIDERVMSFVERVLDEKPGIQLADLYRQAQEVSDSVRHLSKRQFNARYPLQVKRRRSQALRAAVTPERREGGSSSARPGSRVSGPPQASRDSIRQVLMQFATDIAGAEERKDLARVLANVDRYVDQVLKGASRA